MRCLALLLHRLERLELTFCGRGLTDSAADALAAAGPLDQLRELTLRGAYRLNDTSLCKILRNMPNLQVLRLPQNSLLTEDSIKQLPSLVPLLRSVSASPQNTPVSIHPLCMADSLPCGMADPVAAAN